MWVCVSHRDNAHFIKQTPLLQQISALMSPGVHKHELTQTVFHFTMGRMKHSNCSIIMTTK